MSDQPEQKDQPEIKDEDTLAFHLGELCAIVLGFVLGRQVVNLLFPSDKDDKK